MEFKKFYRKICENMIDNYYIEEFVKILKQQHLEVDIEIKNSLEHKLDNLEVQRLKKKKLHIKDRIIELQQELNPDIIA